MIPGRNEIQPKIMQISLKKAAVVVFFIIPSAAFVILIVMRHDAYLAKLKSEPPRVRSGQELATKLVGQAIYSTGVFPITTNGVFEGGDVKIRKLMSFLKNDASKNPGKIFHKLYYSLTLGTEDQTGETGDIGKSYSIDNEGRNFGVTMIVRPGYIKSDQAFFVATYYEADPVLYRRGLLMWNEPDQKWSIRTEQGPPESMIH